MSKSKRLRTLPPNWFEFETTRSDSDDCIQCFLEATGKPYNVDVSGSPPFTLPICENHKGMIQRNQLEHISIGYTGTFDSSETELYEVPVLSKPSKKQRVINYVQRKLRGV